MSRIDLIQLRGGTAAQWTTANPVLAAREPGLETDTGKVKYGNGTDHWADLPYAAGGGGSGTDGVGAVFFGGSEMVVPILDDNTRTFAEFIASDDPPRAPRRDDLMVIDSEDPTKINVVQSGLYDVIPNLPLRVDISAFTNPGSVRAKASLEINGDAEPPAYDFNNWAEFPVAGTGNSLIQVLNLPYPQVLLAGDVVRLGFRAIINGLLSDFTGQMVLDPDITMVLTYRGPVTL